MSECVMLIALTKIPAGILKCWSPQLAQIFMPLPSPTSSENKFHETRIKNSLPIEFNLALITTTLCSTTNWESLKVLHTHQ